MPEPQTGNPHRRDPLNRPRPPILIQMQAEAARLKEVAEEAKAATEALAEMQARRLRLPNGDSILIPADAQDGELYVLPDGRSFRLVENATAVLQLTS